MSAEAGGVPVSDVSADQPQMQVHVTRHYADNRGDHAADAISARSLPNPNGNRM